MAGQDSYLNPAYDGYEQAAAQRVGIDPQLLRAIRTQGERSNANQVSSAGARSVYQIIPATRAGLIKNYGIDPYASPQNAALGAALVLKEGLQRNHGDVTAAIGEYHGGIDRRNWGPVNAAYRSRVLGDGALPSTPDASGVADLYGIDPDMAGGGASTSATKVSMAPGAISKPLLEQQAAFGGGAAQQATTAQQPTVPDWGSWVDSYVKNIVRNA